MDREERLRAHHEWQATRPGLNPGDDPSGFDGGLERAYTEWMPIEHVKRYRDHEGDQNYNSPHKVSEIAAELRSGRGMTDPLIMMYHQPTHSAYLGEGNHRLRAAEEAGWSHVPVRVARAYYSEVAEGKTKPVPGPRVMETDHQPDLSKPSEVFSPDYFEKTASATESDLPPKPGTVPIPEGHIRLYHYTGAPAEKIRNEGLLERYARGDGGLGAGNEPSAGVWASTRHSPDIAQRANYVEFHAHPDEISDRAESPWRERSGLDEPGTFGKGNHHVIMKGDVKPEQIIAVHEPWHGHARYINDNPQAKADTLAGEHDSSADPTHPFYDPALGQAIRHIKAHGSSDHEVLYHLTDKHDFSLNPEHAPHDNTFALQDRSGRKGLYGVSDSWGVNGWRAKGYHRPYVAEIHVPKGLAREERWGGEKFLPAEHYDKAKVHRVIPVDQHEKETYNVSKGSIEEHHGTPASTGDKDVRDFTPKEHTEHLHRLRGYLHDVHSWGWNEFNDKHEHEGTDETDDDGMPVRRDRSGNVMTMRQTSKANPSSDAYADDDRFQIRHVPADDDGWEHLHMHDLHNPDVEDEDGDHPKGVAAGVGFRVHPEHIEVGWRSTVGWQQVDDTYLRKGLQTRLQDRLHEMHPGKPVVSEKGLTEDAYQFRQKYLKRRPGAPWHIEAHVLTDWQPTERVFAPTKDDLDPRLFSDDKQMKPEVRRTILRAIQQHWGLLYGNGWLNWSRVYLAGSEASLWWGNNDFDILIGMDYDAFRQANPEYDDLSNAAITRMMNKGFQSDFNDEDWYPDFDKAEAWHLTGYVNPGSLDIRAIKPYAAYDVGNDYWVVEPPVEPAGHHFTESEWYYFEGVGEQVRHVLNLPEPERTWHAKQMYNFIHTDRSRAFGPRGTGVFDKGNALEKYLDQAGLWEPLAKIKWGKTATVEDITPILQAHVLEHHPDLDPLLSTPALDAIHRAGHYGKGHKQVPLLDRDLEPAHEHHPLIDPFRAWEKRVNGSTVVGYGRREDSAGTSAIGVPGLEDIYPEGDLRRGGGKGKPRKVQPGDPQGDAGSDLVPGGSVGQPRGDAPVLRPIEYHAGVKKDLKRLDGTVRAKAKDVIEHLAREGSHHTTESVKGELPGWYSTRVDYQHRVIHQSQGDSLYIGGVFPHDYAAAKRRLGGAEIITGQQHLFYPAEHGGKYHLHNKVTGQALCRGTLLVDMNAGPIAVHVGQERVHPIVCRRCLDSINKPKTAAQGDLHWGGKEQWQPGERAHFEYHCNESHDSPDAPAWYHSHRPVTVLREEDEENNFPRREFPTHVDRAEAGVPVTYRIKHDDGFEHTAFEDELLRHPKHFERPDPPTPKEAVKKQVPLKVGPHPFRASEDDSEQCNDCNMPKSNRHHDQANDEQPWLPYTSSKQYPRFDGVGLKQDDDGKWYVQTHRARSKSYDTPEDIPQKDVDFIESTGSKTEHYNIGWPEDYDVASHLARHHFHEPQDLEEHEATDAGVAYMHDMHRADHRENGHEISHRHTHEVDEGLAPDYDQSDPFKFSGKVRHAPGPDGEKPTGIMIALVPPMEHIEPLLPEDGEHPTNIHLTLAYLGPVEEHSEEQVNRLHELIESWAEGQQPIDGHIQGVGTFVNPDSHVLWAGADLPGGTHMHVSLIDFLKEQGYKPREENGWLPHITLAYGNTHFRFLPKLVERQAWPVREVWLCIGPQWVSYPLGA